MHCLQVLDNFEECVAILSRVRSLVCVLIVVAGGLVGCCSGAQKIGNIIACLFCNLVCSLKQRHFCRLCCDAIDTLKENLFFSRVPDIPYS